MPPWRPLQDPRLPARGELTTPSTTSPSPLPARRIASIEACPCTPSDTPSAPSYGQSYQDQLPQKSYVTYVRLHCNVSSLYYVCSVAFGPNDGDGSIEAYEVDVRFGRDGMGREGIYGMSALTTYPPERGTIHRSADGVQTGPKAQQLRAYTHGPYAHEPHTIQESRSTYRVIVRANRL